MRPVHPKTSHSLIPFAAELDYTLTQTNTLISCPGSTTLNASGGVDATASAGGRGFDSSSSPARPSAPAAALNTQPSAKKPAAGGAPPGGAGDGSGSGNTIALTLKPIGPGIYPTRLLMTSAADVRVIDLELTSQTLRQQFALDFSCAVRGAITQEVPLVNTSEAAMSVQATLDGGKAWSGGREVSVPAGGTVNYVLTFKPMTSGAAC